MLDMDKRQLILCVVIFTIGLNLYRPEGSKLCAILFSIYMCNLVLCLKHCNTHLNADHLLLNTNI